MENRLVRLLDLDRIRKKPVATWMFRRGYSFDEHDSLATLLGKLEAQAFRRGAQQADLAWAANTEIVKTKQKQQDQ